MLIAHDKSLVNEKIISMGLGDLDIHSIRLDRYFTDEEKQHNYEASQSMSREEWGEHCDNIRKKLAVKITAIMDAVNESFTIYQYTDEVAYRSLWDLYFWCNDLYNTTAGKESGRDMSYVTLTLNNKDTLKGRTEIVNRLVEFLEQYEEKSVKAIVQYTALKNDMLIKERAEKIFSDIEGEFIELGNYGAGKVRMIGGSYAFFKKGARKNYYQIDPLALCTMIKPIQKEVS